MTSTKRTREGKPGALRLRRIRRITAGLVHHRAPAWSADGRLIASRLGEGPDSYWVLIDRKGRVARVLEGPVDGGASFAPDGSLAYGRQVGATSEIWLLPSGGAAPRRLLGGDGRLYRDPAFSPDGRSLCYIADDGQEGQLGQEGSEPRLKLWLLDLARDEHRNLLDGIFDSGNLARIGHPTWSPGGDLVYFEAMFGDHSAIYTVHVDGGGGTAQADRLTEPGYRRPAALGPGLVLCERSQLGHGHGHAGETELVLLDHRQTGANERPRSSALLGLCAREPAVVWRKGSPLVVWAMPSRAAPDEPSRYDLHVAELVGLPAPRPSRRKSVKKRAPAQPSAGPPATARRESEAAAPPAPAIDEASVWFERPLSLFSDGAPAYKEPAAP